MDKEYLIIEKEDAQRLAEGQPDEEVLFDLAELFKIFGDSNRIRILYALSGTELCVSDMAKMLGMSASAVSHQLRILKASKLVRCRREGKIIFYMLDDEHVRDIINLGLEHVIE
ncbi:MAG: helix-turn-helix transcriptional regulator [Clostridia bacterium]|nr:helix-turn-helix transcriptional regulator [Clostridia bacterium]